VFTAEGFNRLEIENPTSSSLGIVDLSYSILDYGAPLILMDFGVTATDTDGDTATGVISLNTMAPLSSGELSGTALDDALVGSEQTDMIYGLAGDDWLTGGGGADVLTGGDGADVFVFNGVSDAGIGAARDKIADFEKGIDLIDLSGIDANTSDAADAEFVFRVNGAPSIDPGVFNNSITWYQDQIDGVDLTIIQGDVNGDGNADFEIELFGFMMLDGSDFIL
jgi:hypothetical protein